MQAVIDGGDTSTLRHVHVIARAAPAQKLALVRALQARGEIVAVTGDGVNDVPALQAADIGIAMGERGTRSAREVASIVFLDDNFRTIVQAIAEGRQLFRNLQLSFQYILMIHIPLVITAALIPLAGYPLLYLPDSHRLARNADPSRPRCWCFRGCHRRTDSVQSTGVVRCSSSLVSSGS